MCNTVDKQFLTIDFHIQLSKNIKALSLRMYVKIHLWTLDYPISIKRFKRFND